MDLAPYGSLDATNKDWMQLSLEERYSEVLNTLHYGPALIPKLIRRDPIYKESDLELGIARSASTLVIPPDIQNIRNKKINAYNYVRLIGVICMIIAQDPQTNLYNISDRFETIIANLSAKEGVDIFRRKAQNIFLSPSDTSVEFVLYSSMPEEQDNRRLPSAA